jgi:hypothetical protein
MYVTGRLIDEDSGSGIPGVSVAVVQDNRFVGPGAVTDYNGVFVLDNDFLTLGGTASILISSVGYQPMQVDPVVFERSSVYSMQKQYQDLTDFTVTAQLPTKKDYTGLWLGAGLVAFLFLTRNWKYTNG